MKQVHVAQNPPEAYLIKGFLEANGIKAVVQGEDLFGIRGGIPVTPSTSPSVWVAEADVAEATRLVEDFFRAEVEHQEVSWRCANCGEMIEGQFTECWNCGTSRDADLLQESSDDPDESA